MDFLAKDNTPKEFRGNVIRSLCFPSTPLLKKGSLQDYTNFPPTSSFYGNIKNTSTNDELLDTNALPSISQPCRDRK